MDTSAPLSGRLRAAPENFLDRAALVQVADEARHGRRGFIRSAFAAAAAGLAVAPAAARAAGDPAILELPEHTREGLP